MIDVKQQGPLASHIIHMTANH